MMRRRATSNGGTDRWMISWSDLLTLLFASMVVLYASAARARLTPPQSPRAANPPDASPAAATLDRLRQSLSAEIAADRVRILRSTEGMVITLRDGAYFAPGSAEVKSAALDSLSKIAAIAGPLPNPIRLEGHSDFLPIHNQRFRDNWSLSAARSAAVLSLLETRFRIPARRLAMAAYADNQPAAENESVDGRARNRRVDIVILDGAR